MKRPVLLDDLENEVDIEDETFNAVMVNELHDKLYKAIESLDEKYLHVAKYKLIYEYDDKKIAELLDISHENVRVRYHRAKQMIKNILKPRLKFSSSKRIVSRSSIFFTLNHPYRQRFTAVRFNVSRKLRARRQPRTTSPLYSKATGLFPAREKVFHSRGNKL